MLDVNIVQAVGTRLELGQDLQDDVVLIRLRVESIDLPLPECVVKGGTNLVGIDVETRGGGAVIFHMSADSIRLLIRNHVGDFWELAEFCDKFHRPVVEFVNVGILERILVLRPADAVVDRQILNRLQVQMNSGNLLRALLQASDDGGGGFPALLERLEVNLDATAIQRCVGAIRADE